MTSVLRVLLEKSTGMDEARLNTALAVLEGSTPNSEEDANGEI